MTASALRLVSSPTPTRPQSPTETIAIPFVERVPPGKLIEISAARGAGAHARTTTTVAMLRAAQREGETAAWIQPSPGSLYPPDLQDSGIDLDALAVLHIPPGRSRARHAPLLKAAELLLRSGAFGFLVLDLCIEGAPPPSSASSGWAGRLLGLARQHESRVILLTEKPASADSLGPLVGIRLEPRRERCARSTFALALDVLKNKAADPSLGTHGSGDTDTPDLICRGPWGLV